MKKKIGMMLTICLMAGVLTACGDKKEAETPATVESPAAIEAETIEADTAEQAGTTEAAMEETEEVRGGMANFDVDIAKATEFAQNLQKAVADKDIEALAGLMTFPNYVSIYDKNDNIVETSEDFIAFGADKIFTQEFVDSIASADIENLEPSMAGFTLVSKDDPAAPCVTFGMTEGELKITGINY